jgi:preprotein translocase subunit SecG
VRRTLVVLAIVLLALTALAFVLAHVGGGHGLTRLFGGQ